MSVLTSFLGAALALVLLGLILWLPLAVGHVAILRQIEIWIYGSPQVPPCHLRLDATALNDRVGAGVSCHGWLGRNPVPMLAG